MENIRPLKTEADYDWAIAEITRYFENEPEVGSLDGDRFDVLATLVEAYENKHYLIEASDPVDGAHSAGFRDTL
ncbi:helix-turn-helix domain-containing protein [Mesorhizobium erdmanii]|uniref:Transcriptional regulator n=1 Tax=Mesorhizobium erdmanii TaxID=1777866 RepID=A0A6M7UL75_9HYPH|nr:MULTISPECIES: transcriptional regulator [Mesorhizobium]OBQ70946.1 transcriptional regulator [Mesorhizobium loti]QKC76627.1 transcriptional regulator [Mesorhizobium erdmanii]